MKQERVIIVLLFLFAFVLRFYDIAYPAFRWADENAHVPAATNYWDTGQFEPDNWEHPPLRHLILKGFLWIIGDNPYGWRLRNILFGSLAVVLTYILAYRVVGRKPALMAALLLATDPLHVVLSRYTFEEIYGGAFSLAAAVLYADDKRTSIKFALSAFFMGCALATKWYYAPCWLLIVLLSLLENDNYKNARISLFISCTYLLIPLSIFTISYYPWFGRGYTFSEFIEFITNAYYSLQSYQLQSYDPQLVFLKHAFAGEWFLRPVIVGQGTYLDADRGEFILYMNNLPIWILTLPAMILMGVIAARRKSAVLALPVWVFGVSYALFLVVSRPVFIYSAAPLLPFVFIAIAFGIYQMTERFGARPFYAVLAMMVAWNIYLYPLVTAKKVPVAPYKVILDSQDINIH